MTIKEINNQDELEEIITNNDKVVMMVYSDHCGFCKKFKPVFEDLANKYDNDYTFVKTSGSTKLVNNVRGVPTTLFIDNEEVVDVVVGAKKVDLAAKLKNYR